MISKKYYLKKNQENLSLKNKVQVKNMGGGTFFPQKILKKTPQKTTVFEMDARYATDRFLRLQK